MEGIGFEGCVEGGGDVSLSAATTTTTMEDDKDEQQVPEVWDV